MKALAVGHESLLGSRKERATTSLYTNIGIESLCRFTNTSATIAERSLRS